MIDEIFEFDFLSKINFQMEKKIYPSFFIFIYTRNNLLSIAYSYSIGVNNQFHLHLINFQTSTRSKTKPRTKKKIYIYIQFFHQKSPSSIAPRIIYICKP